MRKLTGIFAALLMALTVSPVVASTTTSDDATNDYTATVNSDITITTRNDGTATVASQDQALRSGDATEQSADSANVDSSGNVSVTISPTEGSEATFENDAQFDLASNVDFNFTVEPINTPTEGEFANADGSASTGYSTDNLYITVRAPNGDNLQSDDWVQLNGDGTPTDIFGGTASKGAQSPGEYNGQNIGYSLDTPDDLDPSTDYVATMQWKATAN